ncbi:MAG: helix-hairpin-helix domain-containing protein, partial [Acidimicrobiia bacterium]|nr:helix-hairpin-helix domain-containing protein [Acidimicrobiia bacterium]
TKVKGIGPVYAGKLADHGITTFVGLAAADATTIAEALDVSPEQVADWSNQARGLS